MANGLGMASLGPRNLRRLLVFLYTFQISDPLLVETVVFEERQVIVFAITKGPCFPKYRFQYLDATGTS